VPDLLEHMPDTCPYGHDLGRGRYRVSWTPCICGPAQEAAARGRGMGHARIDCKACEDEGRTSVMYEPPHEAA
jgi:hypothetical protein